MKRVDLQAAWTGSFSSYHYMTMISSRGEIFGRCKSCLGFQTTHCHFNGKNKLSSNRGRGRSCRLAGHFPYDQQSVNCLFSCTALSKTIQLNTVIKKEKSERETLIAWTKLIWREMSTAGGWDFQELRKSGTWMWQDRKVYASTDFTPRRDPLLFISVSGRILTRAVVRQWGLSQKNFQGLILSVAILIR